MTDAITRLISDAAKTLRLLSEAGGVDAGPELVRGSLLLMLQSLRREAAEIAEDPKVDDDVRARCHRFVSSVDALRAGAARVDDYLIELTEGWRCESCASTVASGAVLRAEEKGSLGFRCQRCGEDTKATRSGVALFVKLFGSTEMSPEEARARGVLVE